MSEEKDKRNTEYCEEEAIVLNLPNLEKGALIYPIRLQTDKSVMTLKIWAHGAKLPDILNRGDKVKVRVGRWRDSKEPRSVELANE